MPSSENLCLETEKTPECAEKHEDTIKDVKKGLQGCPSRASSSWGGTRQFLGWSPFFKCHTLLKSRCDLKRTPCTR